MDQNTKLFVDVGELLEFSSRYRRLVDKLNYLIVPSPDISFAGSTVSQFLDALYTSHWDVVVRILSYLKKAPGRA